MLRLYQYFLIVDTFLLTYVYIPNYRFVASSFTYSYVVEPRKGFKYFYKSVESLYVEIIDISLVIFMREISCATTFLAWSERFGVTALPSAGKGIRKKVEKIDVFNEQLLLDGF